MTFIAQFAVNSPPYVRSPQQESVDIPESHVWEDMEQYERMTNGIIDTSDPIEVGDSGPVKGSVMFPLRFRRENMTGRIDYVEFWYDGTLMRDEQELEFCGHTLVIREV